MIYTECAEGPASLVHHPSSTLSQRFIRSFRQASHEGDPLDVLVTDSEGFAAALADAPFELARVLQEDTAIGPSGPACVNQSAFASAACDEAGRLLICDEAFAQWVSPHDKLSAALSQFDPRRPSISFLVEDRGKYIAVAAAPLVYSKNWPLALEVKAFLEAGRAKIGIIARLDSTDNLGAEMNTATHAFRLTGLESRVCAGLVKAGHARGAAATAGVSYETARDALKSAMKKAGAANQAELVSLLVDLSSGEMPSPPTDRVLKDMFNLTNRQTEIALLAASGIDRNEISATLGVSHHRVKTELSALYAILNVRTLGNLSRAIAQIKALTAIAQASGIELVSADHATEPLRLLPRKGRKGRIALADHGPVSALPCLIIHTATTGRHLPSAHIAQLQSLGLRPIAFDRPGTGLSDVAKGPLLQETALDMIDILDGLSIDNACIIARGGSMVMAHFVAHHRHRFMRGVSLNPEPRPTQDTNFLGFVGNVKRLVFGQPKIIENLAKHLAQRAARKKVESLVLRALASSRADLATLREPGFMAAYLRATQQSALQSGAGFVAISQTEPSAPDIPIADGSHITILMGEEDPLYRHHDGLERWTAMWPNCRVESVSGAGRLLQFQRPDLIAKALLSEV